MHKWSRRRAHLSLLISLFTLILLTTLLSHHTSNTIHSSTDHPPSFPTHTTTFNTSLFSPNQWLPGGPGWSRACASPRSYRSRRGGAAAQRKWWKERSLVGSCDLFSGRWVYDERLYPLYNESECPWMSDQLACRKHGRPEEQYKHWRWQPHGCHLNRWNALEMLEKLRGKRLMFVGDSLNRGQWISMVCLLQSVIPADKKSMSPNAALTIFKMEEYNATVEFYWAPLLVESNSDDPVNHRLDERIILPDKLLKHVSQWENADILVFNSYLWWRSGPKIKLLWSREDSVCEEADGLDAMTLAMETWADWVSSRADPRRQRVFFVTMSPTHLWSREWNPGSEGNCYQETTPINIEGYWGSGSDLDTMRMVDNILTSLGSKVTVLNITQLSEYRKDGHPSIYRKFWETISPEQLSNPMSYSDCIHWCLPGVPDVWNELLFNLL
ncbi:putative PMR5 domain, PC-Esterase [Dioscorea sansibarensis]